MQKKILITGVDGFIGSSLKNYFTSKEFQVFGTTYFKSPQNEREIHFDITQDDCIFKLWRDENFETIIHTIGLVDQTKPFSEMYAVNAQGTKYICDYAKNTNCKHLIFTGSVSAYGLKVMGENRAEKIKIKTKNLLLTPYGRSKAIAEQIIEKSGLNYTIIRLPIVLGSNDTFITPSILPKILDNTIFSCGETKRKISLLYVDNLGSLMEALINLGPINQSVNCISDSIFWEDLVKEFAINLGREYNPEHKSKFSIFTNANNKDYQFIASYSAFGAHYLSNTLSELLGDWSAPYNWKDGVKEAVENYIAQNDEKNI
ncbi:MAG: NAD(P)-dependent oxidoreductase [Promethearchaeota archaeon]|nr:MAG: NAD(P)-dependent oxidoreductase [Candidatus Lokiarchaeota archaeon]